MDRRVAVYRAIAECRALDTANDVLALSQEGRVRLVQAHSAHVADDWSKYLDAVDSINTTFVRIADTARLWADDVTSAPQVHPDQLPLRLAA
jgi:hypothetical protein